MKQEKEKKPRGRRKKVADAPAKGSILIEKDIPIPPRTRSVKFEYPFKEMEVGDSFIIDYSDKNYRKLYSSMKRYRKFNEGVKYTIRTFKDENHLRCWRIK